MSRLLRKEDDRIRRFLKSQLKNVDFGTIEEFELILNQNGCWEQVVQNIHMLSFSKFITEKYITDKAKTFNYSPAKVLLNELYKRNTRVTDVIPWLEMARLDRALMLFKPDEPLEIIEQPVKISLAQYEIILTCKAIGFPTPKYQWYKDNKELIDQITSELYISNITLANEGIYHCKVYNFDRLTDKESLNVIFSQSSIVKVNYFKYNEKLSNGEDFLEIMRHPVSAEKVQQGANLVLTCQACSETPVNYQWLKNRAEIAGENKPELKLYNIRPKNGIAVWSYSCLVCNDKTFKISKEAKISLDIPNSDTQFFANRKLALLLGNQKYETMNQLFLPSSDVVTLANILREKGFRVFAFLNLTLTEMKNAVEMFSELIEENDYVVFYYAGHGFEAFHTFMSPVEASEKYLPEDSLSVEYVLEKFQDKTPALILMLIDMCRTNPSREVPLTFDSNSSILNIRNSNTLVSYAASPNNSALEYKRGRNGVFIHYLKKYLCKDEKNIDWKPRCIVDVLYEVKREMDLKSQSPWTAGNLSRELTLDDYCDSRTASVNSKLDRIWEDYRNDLTDQVLIFERVKALVRLQFCRNRKIFLNALDIVLTIENLDDADNNTFSVIVNIHMRNIVNGVLLDEVEKSCTPHKIYTISNIQRLQNDLILIIGLSITDKRDVPEIKPVNLGLPLIAKRRFWENQIDY